MNADLDTAQPRMGQVVRHVAGASRDSAHDQSVSDSRSVFPIGGKPSSSSRSRL
jgi:hypothetical protein